MKKRDFINYIDSEKNRIFDELGDTAQDFCNELDIDHYYISDEITEYCDSMVDLYSYNLEKWMVENMSSVENAINVYGWDGCGHDLHKATQYAQFDDYFNDIYTDMDEILQVKFCELVSERLADIEQDDINENARDILDNYLCEVDENKANHGGLVDFAEEFITEIMGADDETVGDGF